MLFIGVNLLRNRYILPVAISASYEVSAGGSLLIELQGQPEGVSFELEQAPTKGTLFGFAPSVEYVQDVEVITPTFDFFTFRVTDGVEYSNYATISINIV